MPEQRYRWITAEGHACSPWHRSIVTAARFAARSPRVPRITPRPHSLLAEWRSSTGRLRRRALSAAEREQLVTALQGTRGAPSSAQDWITRQKRVTAERRRRRASLGRITGHLAAHHDTRRITA